MFTGGGEGCQSAAIAVGAGAANDDRGAAQACFPAGGNRVGRHPTFLRHLKWGPADHGRPSAKKHR